MKTFQEPNMEITLIEVADIICESVDYDQYFKADVGDDLIGWR